MIATVMVKPTKKPATLRPRAQDIDRQVGVRIRERRILLGLTQQQLAELTGVTYQQAHKYEKGINRVAAGRLYSIARALGVEVGYFYEGAQAGGGLVPSPRQRMLLDLTRNFLSIADPRHREAVATLARLLAECDGDPRAVDVPVPDRFGSSKGQANEGSQVAPPIQPARRAQRMGAVECLPRLHHRPVQEQRDSLGALLDGRRSGTKLLTTPETLPS